MRSLLGLPFRIGARCAGLALHGTVEVAERAVGLVGLVSRTLGAPGPTEHRGVGLDGSPHDRPRTSPDRPWTSPDRPRTSPDRPAQPPNGPSAQRPAPAPPAAPATVTPLPGPEPPAPEPPGTEPPASIRDLETPRHVSEEATLVEAFAEPGAEEGAGAQIHVAEPWKGYRQMRADDVIDRIGGASVAELAAVQLYEQAGRGRQSVLAAVESALRRAGPSHR